MPSSLNAIFIEPFYGGSHRHFLDTWVKHSRHQWHCITDSAHHWKWRMRASALASINELERIASDYDVIVASSFVDLAALRGAMARRGIALPIVMYMHENQASYPVQNQKSRDYHFAMTHISGTAAADEVWWNSAFNRESFVTTATDLLSKLPKAETDGWLQQAQEGVVMAMGLDLPSKARDSRSGPLRIVWNQRWEFDKNPNLLVSSMQALLQAGHDFELYLLGQDYKTVPASLEALTNDMGPRLKHAGFVKDRDQYFEMLQSADIVLSTALHEFFGIAVVEASHAGCVPVLPRRLSYPEVFSHCASDEVIFYEKDADLAHILGRLCADPDAFRGHYRSPDMSRYAASIRIPSMDQALSDAVGKWHKRMV